MFESKPLDCRIGCMGMNQDQEVIEAMTILVEDEFQRVHTQHDIDMLNVSDKVTVSAMTCAKRILDDECDIRQTCPGGVFGIKAVPRLRKV